MKHAINVIYLIAAFAVPENATANNRSSVDIKAGQLGDAIIQLGQQTGTSIGISDQRTTRLTVRAVRGQLTPTTTAADWASASWITWSITRTASITAA